MTDREARLVLGGLLHDIGKVIYRQGGDRKRHSLSGYEFLKNEIPIDDEELLDCIRYHHGDALEAANPDRDSLAYIVYIADKIVSAADRRQEESEDAGFERSMPLQSVFNILNRNQEELYYAPVTLDAKALTIPGQKKENLTNIFMPK